MLKNYFQIGLRTLLKDRIYSVINIIGLTIGLWACMTVSTVVIDDLSYDKHWSRADDLYRIISVTDMGLGTQDHSTHSWAGLPPELKKLYPEVEGYASIRTSSLRLKLREGDAQGVEVSVLQADTSVWKMLDFTVLQGTPRHYKAGYSNIMITEGFRNKFFPGQDVVGDILYDLPTFDANSSPYIITGVIEDLPANSHLRAEVVHLTKGRTEQLNKAEKRGTMAQHYLLMRPGTDMKRFAAKINDWYTGFLEKDKPTYKFEFQPIKDIYLHSGFAADQEVKGNFKSIYIFSGVAALLLLVACINFVNLGTARAFTRLHESGIRKVLGAGKRQLIIQSLTESLLFFGLATVLAFAAYLLSLRPLENFLGHALVETFTARLPLFWAAIGLIFLVSLFTAIYPAWLLSGFNPVTTLKGTLFPVNSSGQLWLRKGLVVLQFSISIVVVAGMIVVQQQLRFMENKDPGFNKDNLLSIGYISWDGKGDALRRELLQMPGVESASISRWTPTKGLGVFEMRVEVPEKNGAQANVYYITGDADLAKTLGVRLKKGRFLTSKDTLGKKMSYQPVLITATTAKIMGITALNERASQMAGMPVGIIEDIHYQSMRKSLVPVVIRAEESPRYGGMFIRIKPGMEKQVVASLRALWKRFYPQGKQLELNWVDDLLQKQYKSEARLSHLLILFSGLGMFLAALGIFGLIVHAAARRTREIGIRKALGASVAAILTLLSKDFIKLVLLAILIATPVAWYVMNRWLQDFAYRIEIQWWMFGLPGGLAVVVAFLAISLRSVKAALMNPVKSLRSV